MSKGTKKFEYLTRENVRLRAENEVLEQQRDDARNEAVKLLSEPAAPPPPPAPAAPPPPVMTHRALYKELRQTNPLVAAQYILAHQHELDLPVTK